MLATGAVASVAMAPPLETLAAVEEALAAGIRLIVTVAEGVPQHDAVKIGRAVRRAGATWIGASTPGLAVPGEIKLGFLPDVCLRPGPLAIMSKSGTLSYEIGYRLVHEGLGQNIWVGVGGDPVKGVRFADLLPVFFADERTRAIVLVGEIGGSEEEECADALLRLGVRKPLYALIAGREAKEGVSMGHAGALVFGDAGTFASKKAAPDGRRRARVRLDRSADRGVRARPGARPSYSLISRTNFAFSAAVREQERQVRAGGHVARALAHIFSHQVRAAMPGRRHPTCLPCLRQAAIVRR